MKKIKGLLFAFVALFAFTLAMVKVSAEVTFAYDADSDTKANYTSNAPITLNAGNDLASVSTVRKCDIKATKAGMAVYAEDESISFVKGMVPGGNCNNATSAALKVTSKVAGAKIRYYYTTSDSKFATGDTSTDPVTDVVVNPGSLWIMDTEGNHLKEFPQIGGENNKVYLAEYTINTASTTILIGSDKRLITFAFELVQGEVAQEHTVTIMDGENELKQQKVVSGETLSFEPKKYGYDFAGYYTDNTFDTPFEGVVNADVTVYVKWLPWDIKVEPHHLNAALITKVAESFASFDASQPLSGTIFTIMKGCQTETSSLSIKTAGGVAPKTEEKGIKVVAPEAGTLTVRVVSGGSTARNARLNILNGTTVEEIPAVSGDPVFLADQTTEDDIRVITYHLDAAGTYYFGGSNGLKVFEMTYVSDFEPRTEFYVQSGYNDEGTELVRGIMICENISQSEIATTFDEGLMKVEIYDEDNLLLDVTDKLIIANRLTNKGATYVADVKGSPYEFGVKDNTLYVVAVIAVSNYAETGLAEEYVGKTLTIKLSGKVEETFQVIESKTVVVQGAAGRPQA